MCPFLKVKRKKKVFLLSTFPFWINPIYYITMEAQQKTQSERWGDREHLQEASHGWQRPWTCSHRLGQGGARAELWGVTLPTFLIQSLLSDGRDIGNIPFQVSKRTLTQISSSRETAPSLMALVICLLVQGWIQGLTYTGPPLCHWATPYPDLMVCRTLKFFLIFFVLSARKINMQMEPTQTMFPRVAPFLIHLAHVYLVWQ